MAAAKGFTPFGLNTYLSLVCSHGHAPRNTAPPAAVAVESMWLSALIHLVHYLNCNASVLKVHKEAFVCWHELFTQSHAPGQSSTPDRVVLIAFCHCSKVKQRSPAADPFKVENEEK